MTCLCKYSPLNDVTHLGGGVSAKSLCNLSKMGDKGGGGQKIGDAIYGRPLIEFQNEI